MHQVLTKHPSAEDFYGSDPGSQLGGAETLTPATQMLVVMRGSTNKFDAEVGRFVPVGPWTDVSAQFVTGSISLSGAVVQAKLKKRAAAGEQVAGLYVVKAGARTNTLRDPIDT